MKITFFSCNSSYSHTSLAYPFLRSYADSQNTQNWQFVECTIKEQYETILNKILSTNCDILLVSVYIFNHQFINSILCRLRRLAPQIKIIAGGPEFLGNNERFLREDSYDLIIRGEGEIPLKKLIENGFIPENILGLCFLEKGSYCDFGFAEEVENLDEIPSPYEQDFFDLSKPFIQFETSRGCPNKCAFCTSSLTQKVRFYSIEKVRQNLQLLQTKNIIEIRILDRSFNCSPKRTIQLLKMFREEFPNIRFHTEFEPSFITAEILQELAKMPKNQLHIEIGLQTFSQESYNSMNRQSNNAKSGENLQQLAKMTNFEVHADLIAGLPGISLQQLTNDIIKMIKISPAEIQLENLKLLRGTKLENFSKLKFSPEAPYEILQSDAMNFSELLVAKEFSKMIDIFYNYSPLQKPFSEQVIKNEEFLVDFHNFLQKKDFFAQTPTPEKRFKLFFDFCDDSKNNVSLLINYFLAGFSPEHGLFPSKIFKTQIPENALFYAGEKTPNYHRVFCYNEKFLIAYEKGHITQKSTKIAVYKI